ncbi:MAG: hypothetical protein ACOCRX_02505 [Candidatus Woesearchaeota archaeon]
MNDKKGSLGIFILLIFISTLLFMFNFLFLSVKVVERNVFEYQFYNKVLEETNITEDLIHNFSKRIENDITKQQDNISTFDQNISLIIQDTINSEWIENEILNLVNNSLKSVKEKEDDQEIILNLEDKKIEFEERINSLINDEINQEIERVNNSNINLEDLNLTKNETEKFEFENFPTEINISKMLGNQTELVHDFYNFSKTVPYFIFLLFLGTYFLLVGAIKAFKWMSSVILASSSFFLITLYAIKNTLIKAVAQTNFNFIDKIANIFIERSIYMPISFIIISLIILITTVILEEFYFD